MKRVSDELRQLVLSLHPKGLSARDAAQRANCPIGTVHKIWWRAGLRRKRPSLSAEELEAERQRLRDLMDARNRLRRLKTCCSSDERNRSRRKCEPALTAKLVVPEVRFLRPEDRRAGR